jgi:hypothetical protein
MGFEPATFRLTWEIEKNCPVRLERMERVELFRAYNRWTIGNGWFGLARVEPNSRAAGGRWRTLYGMQQRYGPHYAALRALPGSSWSRSFEIARVLI